MHNLKATSLSTPSRRTMTLIPRLPLTSQIFETNITNLKKPQRQGMLPILPNGLQQTRQQTRAHNLVLSTFRILQANRQLPIIHAIQRRKVLIMAAQDQRHDLGPTRLRRFIPQDIAEPVDG